MSTTVTEVHDDHALPPAQEARRLRILEAARDLAIEGGYDGVQMRDVADRAEVALGTLYRYFRSKVQLLIALMHHETTRLAGRLESRPPAGTPQPSAWRPSCSGGYAPCVANLDLPKPWSAR
jgi:TetR/AcrR family transcriptional regulator, cholesterol catabolism regulator